MIDDQKERAVNETRFEIRSVRGEVSYARKARSHLEGGLSRLNRRLKKDEKKLDHLITDINKTVSSNGRVK